MRAGPQRRRTLTSMILRSVRLGVRRGLWGGREARSYMSASPSVR